MKLKGFPKDKNVLAKVFLIFAGLASLTWFLIRVIPKPSRASYPCQRAAFPMASAFVIWVIGLITSVTFFKKARKLFLNARYVAGGLILLVTAGFFTLTIISSSSSLFADTELSDVVIAKPSEIPVLDELPSKVGVARSDKTSCFDIKYAEIEAMTRLAIQRAGGLEDIVKDGNTVILKPNLVSNHNTLEYNGKVTDWRVLEIVAKIVRELNPNGKIYIMEGGATKSTYDDMVDQNYKEIDYVDDLIAIENPDEWKNFDAPDLVKINLSDEMAKFPDNMKPNNSRAIYLKKLYYEADVLISVPVLKNHRSAGITGSIKNVGIGGMPAHIYGKTDVDAGGRNLRSATIEHDSRYLHMWIHDFFACRPVDFAVMEGLQGCERGPGSGGSSEMDLYRMNMRMMLAGKDPIALDAIAGLMMMHDPQRVNHLVYLHNDDFGIVDPGRIELVGVEVPDVRRDFEPAPDMEDGKESKFTKTKCTDYNLDYWFENDSLFLSVSNPTHLARIRVSVDGQKINKYIVGSWEKVGVPYTQTAKSDPVVEVTFEDRYLNKLVKQYPDATSILDITAAELKASVYPNPATDLINIEFSNQYTGPLTITIYDASGRMISTTPYEKTWQEFQMPMNISELNRGHYFIQVSTGKNRIAQSGFIKY